MIEFKDVWLSFGEQQVLKGVSFTASAKQTTALAGPSGSGKSTILKILMGFLKPDRGEVTISGENVAGLNEKAWIRLRRNMGMVFQSSALFDSLTVCQNVGFYPHYVENEPWRKVRTRVLRILAEVGLAKDADKMPSELSGGMRRRVALARSLIYRPEILLYDEPTTGLDPQMIGVVNELIEEMNDRYGVTSLVVSHDLECIHAVADHVVLLRNGEAVTVGPPGNLLSSEHPIVVEFTQNWRKQIMEFAGELNKSTGEETQAESQG